MTMLSIVLCSMLLAPVDAAEPSAETYAAVAEAHLRRAAAAELPLGEFEGAHKNFDAAYLLGEDARYLCRALAVADLALLKAAFADDQERRSWEELRRDDLDRLRADSIEKRRANCRFDASGKPPPPLVALLDLDAPAQAGDDTAARSAPPPPSPSSASMPASDDRRPTGLGRAQQVRRARAHAVSGALLTSAGVGLLGATIGVVAVEVQRAAGMRNMIEVAGAEGRKFTEAEDLHFRDQGDALFRGRNTAIGVGIAGLVTLGAGIAVLATRKRATRAYSLLPYGGSQGAGAVLRLKF